MVVSVVVQQLDKNLQGRLVWGAGSPSSMQTVLVWDNNKHHVMAALQVIILFLWCEILMYEKYSLDVI